jgi:hypothetical protein
MNFMRSVARRHGEPSIRCDPTKLGICPALFDADISVM